MRRFRAQLGLQRRDEYLEQIEHHGIGAAELSAHRFVDDRAEDERAPALPSGGLGDALQHLVDSLRRVHEGDGLALEVQTFKLRQQAVAEHLGGDAGAVGYEVHGVLIGHVEGSGVSGPGTRTKSPRWPSFTRDATASGLQPYQSCQTGATPAGRGGIPPRSTQLSPGP